MRFIFVGNRFSVLKKMIQLNCNIVEILVVKNSYLEKELELLGYAYKIIYSKEELIHHIKSSNFDCLVSNGCPYILPISKLKKNNQLFINIHPSLLPDLKGKNPVNGAILFDRKHGVTCHHMDDGIDTGKIISQIEIPITSDTNLGLLYQISFIAEGKVFENAYKQGFIESKSKYIIDNPLYYTRKNEELEITLKDGIECMLRKIRAFGIPSICARFYKNNKEYKILSAKLINNSILNNLFYDAKNNEVLCCYDSSVLVKISEKYIEFTMPDLMDIKVGNNFFDDI